MSTNEEDKDEGARNVVDGQCQSPLIGNCAWFVPTRHTYKTAAEYAKDVEKWVQNASLSYYWQNVASAFPYFLMQQMAIQQQQLQINRINELRTTQPAALTWNSIVSRIVVQIRNVFRSRRVGNIPRVHNPTLGRLAELGGREYKIPRLWKRFTAEFVDFAILFLLKLFFTFIAMDFFDMIDLQKYEEPDGSSTIDYKFALQITSEIFILELIHRIVVCFFEALCLHQGTNGVGGATPGKSLLGLRVVSCESIQPLQGSRVLVWPARDIGFGWALLRSIIKNFSMALFIPTCITMLFFPFHRTVYDILCGCLVVEDVQQFPRL